MISTLICAALGQEMFGAKFHSRAEFYAAFKKIKDGMTTSQVRDILGVPDFVDRTNGGRLALDLGTTIWKYGARSSTDLSTLGWVEFGRGKVTISSLVILPAPAENIISEKELRASLREVDKYSQARLSDVIRLRNYLSTKSVAKTRAILQTYLNCTFYLDSLDLILRLISTNSNSNEAKVLIEEAQRSYYKSYVLISGLPFEYDERTGFGTGAIKEYDFKKLLASDACLNFHKPITIPTNPKLVLTEFENWLRQNSKIESVIKSAKDRARVELKELSSPPTEPSIGSSSSRTVFGWFGKNLQYAIRREDSESVSFSLIGEPKFTQSSVAEFRVEGADGSTIQSFRNSIYPTGQQGTQNLANIGWLVPQGTTFRIRLELDGTTRLTPWLKP